jgi:hypothetical protein
MNKIQFLDHMTHVLQLEIAIDRKQYRTYVIFITIKHRFQKFPFHNSQQIDRKNTESSSVTVILQSSLRQIKL